MKGNGMDLIDWLKKISGLGSKLKGNMVELEYNREEGKGRGILLPRCYLCGNVPKGGIRGGVKIKKAFICEQCEQQIVSLQAGTSNYQNLIEEIKKIW